MTLDDLLRVGATYLDPAKASIAVVTNAPGAEELRRHAALVDAELKTL